MNKDLEGTEFEYTMVEEVSVTHCCRACMQTESDLIKIDSPDEDFIVYHEKLKFCVSDVDWLKDGLSKFICDQCIPSLKIAYDFRKTCLSTDETFKKYLLLIQNEDISNSKSGLDFENLDPSNGENSKEIEEDCEENITLEVNNDLHKDEEENVDLQNNKLENLNVSLFECSVNILEDDCLPSTKCYQRNFETKSNEIIKEISENLNTVNESIESVDNIEARVSENIKNKVEKTHIEVVCPVLDSAKIDKKELAPANGDQINSDSTTDKNSKLLKTKQIHKCELCGKIYNKRANLIIHQRTHTGEKPFECQYCEKRFHHTSHRKEHERRHTGEKPFSCSFCDKRFTIRGELNMHIKSHTGEKNYHCETCDRRCLTATDLKIHLRTHTGEKPYPCDSCGRNFSSSYILSVHKKTHTGDRPHRCTICPKSFTQSSHLKVHMHKHTGEKFYCKQCDKQFPHRSQLSSHIKFSHDGQSKAHKCLLCSKSFSFPKELDVHIRVKHLGEKMSCQICEKQFSAPAYLAEHAKVHLGNELHHCTFCNKSFTRKSTLVKHQRSHTGEKPFKCSQCEKSFTQNSSLNVHLRLHGDRPFPCVTCEKTFCKQSDLILHKRNQHKEVF